MVFVNSVLTACYDSFMETVSESLDKVKLLYIFNSLSYFHLCRDDWKSGFPSKDSDTVQNTVNNILIFNTVRKSEKILKFNRSTYYF
jgi:hypothetical protein